MVRCLCDLHGIIKALHKILLIGAGVSSGFKHRVKSFQWRSALPCLPFGLWSALSLNLRKIERGIIWQQM